MQPLIAVSAPPPKHWNFVNNLKHGAQTLLLQTPHDPEKNNATVDDFERLKKRSTYMVQVRSYENSFYKYL